MTALVCLNDVEILFAALSRADTWDSARQSAPCYETDVANHRLCRTESYAGELYAF